MSRILIFDTTLRDGEQSPGATMTTAEKLQMARQLDLLGVDILEAGFPVASPDDLNAVRKISKEVRRPIVAALARATREDVECAAKALEHAEKPRIHVFLATSVLHLGHKLQITEDECVERIEKAVTLAKQYADDVEFSPEDATRTNLAFLSKTVQTAIDCGATTVNIPDTVGYTYPTEYRRIIEGLFSSVNGIKDTVVSVHCHNDLGLAVANSLAAIEAGARQVECTVNGIGERAGNASMEELVMALRVRNDLLDYSTGISTNEIFRTSQLLTTVTGISPQPNKAIVGKNAFAHEAGIHQAGVIRHQATYEIMRPEWVGVPESRLVLGKHSGRAAVAKRCSDLGYDLDADAVKRVYDRLISVADRKKHILDEDLLDALRQESAGAGIELVELNDLNVVCGGESSRASVQLRDPTSGFISAEADGSGPFAAVFTAMDSMLKLNCDVDQIELQQSSSERDKNEVSLNMTVASRSYSGRGSNVDVIRAAAQAYLDAANKALSFSAYDAHNTIEAPNSLGV